MTPRYKSVVIRRMNRPGDPLDSRTYYLDGKSDANDFDWLINQQAGSDWELVNFTEISMPVDLDPAYRAIFKRADD